jgi:hypothetical protein
MAPVRTLGAAPPALAAHGSLARVDYADGYRVEGVPVSSLDALGWLRRVFDGRPAAVRAGLRLGWRGLGLRLGPQPSPAHVLGWRIEAAGPHVARLAVDGRLGIDANLVLATEHDSLTLSTLVRLRGPAARVLWAAVRPFHVAIVRALLASGAQ